MNKRQWAIVLTWTAFFGVLILIVSADLTGHGKWIKPILVVAAVFALIFERRGRQGGLPFERMEEIMADYPFTKWWLIACVACILVFLIVAMNSAIRVTSYSSLLAAFLVPFAPIVLVSEYERFVNAGRDEGQ